MLPRKERPRKTSWAFTPQFYSSRLQKGAAARGYCWKLSDEDAFMLFQQSCFYCGAPPKTLVHRKGWNGEFLYNGLDRIVNTEGYTTGNTVPCCSTCNFSKGKRTFQEFTDHAIAIASYQQKAPSLREFTALVTNELEALRGLKAEIEEAARTDVGGIIGMFCAEVLQNWKSSL